MIRKLLYRLTNHLPARIISDNDKPYMERYYVGTLFGTLFGIRFYLHQFVASDPDRGRHDHPWPWAFSILLAGNYLEETHSGTHEVRWFNALIGDSFHRVILKERYGRTLPVWTLFAHRAKRTKRWGFMRPTLSPGCFGYFLHEPSIAEDWWLTAPKGLEIRSARGDK